MINTRKVIFIVSWCFTEHFIWTRLNLYFQKQKMYLKGVILIVWNIDATVHVPRKFHDGAGCVFIWKATKMIS